MAARYFFDVVDGHHLVRDLFGVDLANDDEAREEAIALLHDLPRDMIPEGDHHHFIVRARDEAGDVAYEASLTLQGTRRPGR